MTKAADRAIVRYGTLALVFVAFATLWLQATSRGDALNKIRADREHLLGQLSELRVLFADLREDEHRQSMLIARLIAATSDRERQQILADAAAEQRRVDTERRRQGRREAPSPSPSVSSPAATRSPGPSRSPPSRTPRPRGPSCTPLPVVDECGPSPSVTSSP